MTYLFSAALAPSNAWFQAADFVWDFIGMPVLLVAIAVLAMLTMRVIGFVRGLL